MIISSLENIKKTDIVTCICSSCKEINELGYAGYIKSNRENKNHPAHHYQLQVCGRSLDELSLLAFHHPLLRYRLLLQYNQGNVAYFGYYPFLELSSFLYIVCSLFLKFLIFIIIFIPC